MYIGCHAVLFTDAIAKNTEETLCALHQAGAEGVEIGSRFFGIERSDDLNAALKAAQMSLSGLHIGIPLTELLDNPDKAREKLTGAAVFLQRVSCKEIIMTGDVDLPKDDEDSLGDSRLCIEETLNTIARNLNDITIKLKEEYGVQIHYHNHNWEFKNGGKIFYALVKYAPDLCFALDTGWAAVSGYDPVEIIRDTCVGRVRYVHLRDYKKDVALHCRTYKDFADSYVEIGEGDMDFQALLSALEETSGQDCWAVIEYEKGPVDLTRYQKAVTYMRAVLNEINGEKSHE